jgi:hypothetical protein
VRLSLVGLQLLELLEETAQVVFRNPNPGVRDCHFNPRLGLASCDVDATPVGSELDGVGDQVQEHLPYLRRVSDQANLDPLLSG